MQQQGGCHHRGSPCKLVAVSVATIGNRGKNKLRHQP